MGYPLDVAAQSAALDALLGDGAAAGVPTAFELALFDGDPRDTHSLELPSTGGYARVTGITNDSTNFPDAVDGAKSSAVFSFAASSGAWAATGTWFVLYDAADSTTAWFFGPLTSAVIVSGAGYVVELSIPIYWNTES